MEFSDILAEATFLRTYSKTKEDGTKETWEETCDRVCQMHVGKFPEHKVIIEKAFEFVREGVVLPSMRSLQYGGKGILDSNCRNYNCSYLPVDSVEAFGEYVYLLMNGCGVGFGIHRYHVQKLPKILRGSQPRVFIVPDTREGWADSIKELIRNPLVKFDYSLVRPSGAPLSSGGTASGPGPLKESHEKIRTILQGAEGRKLRPVEVLDIMCLCAAFVVVGGARRAASICVFDHDETDVLTAKTGQWWETHPWRAYSNNSAFLDPDTCRKEEFDGVLDACFEGGWGEPGLVMLRDAYSQGVNPCCEISLKNHSFCNLTEVNLERCYDGDHFDDALWAATVIGTLQAAYTDFSYLRPIWKKNTEEQALLGISFTGLANHWGNFTKWLDSFSVCEVVETNKLVARRLGIKPAQRIGCIKPSGTTSVVMSTTSGIHAAHAPYYIRRVRINKDNPVARALREQLGECEFFQQDVVDAANMVISAPMKANEGAIVRGSESAVELLNRAKWVRDNWIAPTHAHGVNMHNVSLTVSYAPYEIEQVKEWMWDNRGSYTGISLLPKNDIVYPMAPFEEVSEEEYKRLKASFDALTSGIDLSAVKWKIEEDEVKQTVACSGGSCELF